MPKFPTITTTTATTIVTSTTTRSSTSGVTNGQNEQSLGPNLQSRLEALEAAMGVRLNVAKRQGRQSLSNTASSSPMQVSPTSTSSVASSSTTTTSLSASSRHNIPTRPGQGVQRSASSCDVENRPGPIKRLKPSLPIETSSSSTATAIATIKKYTPTVRRPITTIATPIRPVQPKQSTANKQRSSPIETVSIRSMRSSTIQNSTIINATTVNSHTSSSSSSTSRTTVAMSVKSSHLTSGRQPIIHPSSSSSPPPPAVTSSTPPPLLSSSTATISTLARPIALPQKHRISIFGEQFSDDILKTNLLWINLNEFDDDSRTEILIQFGSIEHFLREQQSFFAKQQQQIKLAARHKNVINRSRYQLLVPKKDRLELL